MRRLLYVCAAADFFVSHRLPLAQAAQAEGFDVHVTTPDDGLGVATIKAAGLTWHHLPIDRGGTNLMREAAAVLFFIKQYRRIRPDIVHHVTIKPVLYGTLAARIAGVPRVVNAISGLGYLFTGERPMRRRLASLLYRLCLGHRDMTVIVQNEEDRAFFVANRLVDPATIVLIPGSGVDLAAFNQPPDRTRPTVVQTCRMLADKGVREFIAAATQLKPSYPDARFVLVGAPDPANPTSIPVAELDAANSAGIIEWLGHRRDIPTILAEATIYCLASYREGLPKSLIEAAAAGLPLITTDTSGCREVVRDDDNGLLVPVADATALAAAIARLLDDPGLRDRLGRAARFDAIARFDVRTIVATQVALYGPAEAGAPQ